MGLGQGGRCGRDDSSSFGGWLDLSAPATICSDDGIAAALRITCACGRGPARHVCAAAGPVVAGRGIPCARPALRPPTARGRARVARGLWACVACGRARAGSAAGARSVFRVLGDRVRMRREDRAWSRPTAVGLAQREGRHQGAVIRAAAASPRRGARRAPRLRKVTAFRRFSWCTYSNSLCGACCGLRLHDCTTPSMNTSLTQLMCYRL